jgi:hypothetical protein
MLRRPFTVFAFMMTSSRSILLLDVVVFETASSIFSTSFSDANTFATVGSKNNQSKHQF